MFQLKFLLRKSSMLEAILTLAFDSAGSTWCPSTLSSGVGSTWSSTSSWWLFYVLLYFQCPHKFETIDHRSNWSMQMRVDSSTKRLSLILCWFPTWCFTIKCKYLYDCDERSIGLLSLRARACIHLSTFTFSLSSNKINSPCTVLRPSSSS